MFMSFILFCDGIFEHIFFYIQHESDWIENAIILNSIHCQTNNNTVPLLKKKVTYREKINNNIHIQCTGTHTHLYSIHIIWSEWINTKRKWKELLICTCISFARSNGDNNRFFLFSIHSTTLHRLMFFHSTMLYVFHWLPLHVCIYVVILYLLTCFFICFDPTIKTTVWQMLFAKYKKNER